MDEAKAELAGDMRRVRGLLPEQEDDFAISAQESFKSTLDPIKAGIAIAGLFITGLALFVGAIGIMNITFVSVRERTREIGTRKALGARRRTILLQFLIEAVSICLIGGFVGIVFSYLLFQGVGAAFPSFPIEFSINLVLVGIDHLRGDGRGVRVRARRGRPRGSIPCRRCATSNPSSFRHAFHRNSPAGATPRSARTSCAPG